MSGKSKKSTKSTKSAKTSSYTAAWFVLALTRIALGFVFLWAFLDKTFGLGLATPAAKSWLAGGSPTTGFLMGASKADGPFADMFASLVGKGWVDWLFMLCLLGVGVALTLGIGLRVAALSGSILMIMMWMASMPLKTNPIIDDHIIYAMVMWVIALGNQKLGLASWWTSRSFVRKNPWLW